MKYADPGWSMEVLMAVKRIVPNIASDQPDKAKSFYERSWTWKSP